jgi:serine/threonine-protein kinase
MANSPARSIIDVGSVIADTYMIEALIGRGGMGSVFLASHKRLPGKQVAIKLLHAEVIEQELLSRFRREAEIASRLGHPNIVTVHDFNVTSDGTPYLVLEYLRGESLAQRLYNGPLPLDQVLSIVRQVGSALAAAHRGGIVHRDLKPQNIFLVPTEVDGRIVEIAKVLDFGISKIRGSDTVKTQESMLLGTPQYMAPEQARGEHTTVDERTDVFAFGAIVYEMLAGHPAFSGASIPEVVFKVVYEQPLPLEKEAPTVPLPIVAAVNQAMAKLAGERFANVSAFVEAMTGHPITAFRIPSMPPPDVDLATGSSRARSTGHDAFANTMGSLDEVGMAATSMPPSALSPVPSVASSAQPIAPLVNVQAMTVESHADSAPPPAPPRARRSPALIVGVAIAGAGVAALVMYLVMRSPESAVATRDTKVANTPQPAADAAVVIAVPDRSADAGAPVVEVHDAAVTVVVAVIDAGVVAKATPDAAVAVRDPKRQANAGPPVSGVSEADEEADPSDLKKAQAALNSGNLDLAKRLANAVINSPANERQQARAYGIRGAIECARDDEETAGIDLRNIPMRFTRIRAGLLASCHSRGYLKTINR